MSQYYIGAVPFGSGALAHTNEGTKWKKHKYLYIQNGRYIYPEDVRGGGGNSAARAARSGQTVSGPSVPRRQTAIASRYASGGLSGPVKNRNTSLNRASNSRWGGRQTRGTSWEGMTNYVREGRLGQVHARIDRVSGAVQHAAGQAASSITSWGASAVNAGRNWIQRTVQNISNTATDVYKLGTGAYVREAQAAYDRNPSPENMNALREAQSRYDNSIFGRVRSMITRVMSAVRGAVSSAGNAARGAASAAGDFARNTVRRVGAATGLNGKRRSTGNRAGRSEGTPTFLGVQNGRNSRRDMYLNRGADVASSRTRPRR